MTTLLRQAELKMWIDELQQRDRTKRLIAAQEVLRVFGEMHGADINGALRMLARGGDLHEPPTWPAADIWPRGGGEGFITCAVRTVKDGVRHEVEVRIATTKKGEHAAQIEEALERGKFELRKTLG